MINIDLSGTCAVVTGAARGIGKAIAVCILKAGGKVHVCDIDAIELEKVIQTELLGASFSVCDVSREEDVANLINDAVASMGGLNVLVNNVGIAGPANGISDLSYVEVEKTFATNVFSQLLTIKYAEPWLVRAREGCVINISSIAGTMGYAKRAVYSASKWAVVGLTKSLAIDMGPSNVRVNAICPGAVQGPPIERAIENRALAQKISIEEARNQLLSQSTMGRMVTAEEVAGLAVYLCSDLAKGISGQIIGVDANTIKLT